MQYNRQWKIWQQILLTATLCLLCSTTCYAARNTLVHDIQKRGVLRVGMDTFLPWAMKDKTGNYIGFEIDVATRLAKDMGVKVEFVPTKWAGIIPSLLTGKFDMIIGGMGITPQRARKVDFSDPYDFSGMAIVAHKKMATGFSSLNDFNHSEIEIACKLGTTAVSAAKQYIPNAKLRLFDDEAQAYQELRNGNVHAVVGSAPRPAFESIKYHKILFLPLKGTFTAEPIGFALRKGNDEALTYFNAWISKVSIEGWLVERHHYWFETRDWAHKVE